MKHFKPLSPEPLLKKPAPYGDQALARIAHVNAVIDQLNGVVAGPVAVNATATLTKEQFSHLTVTSTSPAAVSLTTPSAADIIDAVEGSSYGVGAWFTVDNSGGASTVTLVGGTGVTIQGTATTLTGTVSIFRVYLIDSDSVRIIRLS